MQILPGRGSVTDVELHSLSGTKHIPHSNGTTLRISPYKRPDEEITAAEFLLVFVNHTSHQKRCACEVLIFGRECCQRFTDRRQGWTATQLIDHLVLTARNDKRLADRFAALRHHRTQGEIACQGYTNGTMNYLAVQKQGAATL